MSAIKSILSYQDERNEVMRVINTWKDGLYVNPDGVKLRLKSEAVYFSSSENCVMLYFKRDDNGLDYCKATEREVFALLTRIPFNVHNL